jgi:hypothetical protein
MKTDNSCCRIFPYILFLISGLLALAIWYFDESFHSFSFLMDNNEVVQVIGTVFFIMLLPIGIFYLASEKERFKDKARKFALLGFLPAILFLVFLIV